MSGRVGGEPNQRSGRVARRRPTSGGTNTGVFSTVGAEPRSSWTVPGEVVIANPSVDPGERSWTDPDAVHGVLGPPEADPTAGDRPIPASPVPFWEPRPISTPTGPAPATGTQQLHATGVFAKLRDGETGPLELARDPRVRMAAALVAVMIVVLLIGRLGDLVSPGPPTGAGLGIGAPAAPQTAPNPPIDASTPALGPDGQPPQLVMVAIGGDLSAQRVRRWTALADQRGARLTFFPAVTDLLGPVGADRYHPSRAEPGTAPEGFAGPSDDEAREQVTSLVDSLGSARGAGHETAARLGAEACGPEGTATWRRDEWASELSQFTSVAAHVGDYNAWALSDERSGDLFAESALAGATPACGRAEPEVFAQAVGAGGLRWMAGVESQPPDGWPQKTAGLWRLPRIAADAGADDALARLTASLAGDREPLGVGIAPRGERPTEAEEALVSFVEQACGRQEVRCVTYSEAAGYLDAHRG